MRLQEPRRARIWRSARPFARLIASISCLILSSQPPSARLRLASGRGRTDLVLMQEQLSQLRELAVRHAGGPRTETAIPRVAINLRREATGLLPGLYTPM